MRQIDEVIIHCSASEFGNAAILRSWHRSPPLNYRDIGYHYVIPNGKKSAYADYDPKTDGIVEIGRPLDEEGAHCFDANKKSVGICLVGDKWFTQAQIIALKVLLYDLIKQFPKITIQRIRGHYEYDSGKAQGKTCPNIPMDVFRKEFTKFLTGLDREIILKPRQIKWKQSDSTIS